MHDRPTLIIDWGIGGLSVWRQARRLRPETAFVYLSDTGSLPYGTLSGADLAVRLEQLILHARARWGSETILLACNAASTVLDRLRQRPWAQGLMLAVMREPSVAM